MNQLMRSSPSSNFLLQEHPPVQRVSFPDENRPARSVFCAGVINRWIARWEKEGGAVPWQEREYITL
jgi:hypothetical protein